MGTGAGKCGSGGFPGAHGRVGDVGGKTGTLETTAPRRSCPVGSKLPLKSQSQCPSHLCRTLVGQWRDGGRCTCVLSSVRRGVQCLETALCSHGPHRDWFPDRGGSSAAPVTLPREQINPPPTPVRLCHVTCLPAPPGAAWTGMRRLLCVHASVSPAPVLPPLLSLHPASRLCPRLPAPSTISGAPFPSVLCPGGL